MKKIVCLVLIMIICMSFTVSAKVLIYSNEDTMPSGIYEEDILIKNRVHIKNIVILKYMLSMYETGVLIIEKNGALKGDNIKFSIDSLAKTTPKIIIEDGGGINITFEYEGFADKFASFLESNNIEYNRNSNTITAANEIQCPHEEFICAECGSTLDAINYNNTLGTIISDGNIIIVSNIVTAFVFGFCGYFICMRKKRK